MATTWKQEREAEGWDDEADYDASFVVEEVDDEPVSVEVWVNEAEA